MQHVNYYSSVKTFIFLLSMIPDSIHSFVGVKVLYSDSLDILLYTAYKVLPTVRFKNYVYTN